MKVKNKSIIVLMIVLFGVILLGATTKVNAYIYEDAVIEREEITKDFNIPNTLTDTMDTKYIGKVEVNDYKDVIAFALKAIDDILTAKKINTYYSISSNEFENENKVGTGEKFMSNGTQYTVLVYGDIDGNGSISIRDARNVAKYVANPDKSELTALQKEAGDVYNNGDGLTMRDARSIAKYVASQGKGYVNEKTDKEKVEEVARNFVRAVNENDWTTLEKYTQVQTVNLIKEYKISNMKIDFDKLETVQDVKDPSKINTYYYIVTYDYDYPEEVTLGKIFCIEKNGDNFIVVSPFATSL